MPQLRSAGRIYHKGLFRWVAESCTRRVYVLKPTTNPQPSATNLTARFSTLHLARVRRRGWKQPLSGLPHGGRQVLRQPITTSDSSDEETAIK